MRYRLIVFDLDETLWTIQQDTLEPLRGPFRLVDEHRAQGANGSVELFSGVRALLRQLTDSGRFISLASRSDPHVCEELLALFEIDGYFHHPQFGWESKGRAVLNTLEALREVDKEQIEPEDVIFVDDWPDNIKAVSDTGAATLLVGRDITSIRELSSILD